MSGNIKLVEDDFMRPLSTDPEYSYTLPSRYYTDPEIFELEKEKIFYKSWHFICHVSQVENPGDYVTDTIIDEGIFVIRGQDGELRAFYNVCQHRAHELLQGSGNIKAVITCPYHAWAYGSDGSLRSARNSASVRGFDRKDFSLKPVRVEVLCNLVFVNLDLDAVALAEQAPDLESDIRNKLDYIDELKPTAIYDFGGRPMEAGWKVVVDNYVECYHCEHAHPQFSELICMPSYEHTINGITARQHGPEIRVDISPYKLTDESRVKTSLFWYVWPTTTVNILPGDGDVDVVKIVPHSHTKTQFKSYRLSVNGKSGAADQRDYIENILGMEDLLICESVQRGLFSKGYDQGRFIVDSERSGTDEHVVHFFHRKVYEALAA